MDAEVSRNQGVARIPFRYWNSSLYRNQTGIAFSRFYLKNFGLTFRQTIRGVLFISKQYFKFLKGFLRFLNKGFLKIYIDIIILKKDWDCEVS